MIEHSCEGGHGHGASDFNRAFAIGLALNLAYVVVQIVFGIFGHCGFAGCEKTQNVSFRSTLRAEEPLFSWVSIEEEFLALLGMTEKETFSASCSAAEALERQLSCGLRSLRYEARTDFRFLLQYHHWHCSGARRGLRACATPALNVSSTHMSWCCPVTRQSFL